MTMDALLNKDFLGKKDFNSAIGLRDRSEKINDFDLRSQRELLKKALESAESLNFHTDSVNSIVGMTLAALQESQNQLHEANRRIEHLQKLTTTDEMTQLLNRRGLFEAFEKELDRTNRGISSGGLLIMIDLDNFKTINDTYGHAAGDEALKMVGETLKAHIRRMDMAARFGGDEFVLLFANAGKTKALGRAQSLALTLNSLTLKWKGHKIPVRASIGIKDYAQGDELQSLFDDADATMYKAKAHARAKREATETAAQNAEMVDA